VRLWEVSSGKCLKVLQGHTNGIRLVAFSPDGSLVVSSSQDQIVKVWDVESGQCLTTLQDHTSHIRAVAFSPDRSLFASSDSGMIRLWNVQTGMYLRTMRSDRPYERMNITDVKGLTDAQKAVLTILGAIKDEVGTSD
jgi:WD40 repeat protein